MAARPVLISRSAFLPALLVATGLAFAAPATAKDMKAASKLVPTGKPIDCISPHTIRSSRIIDDQTIDFELGGSSVYRNTLPYKCSGLKSEDRFAYKLSTSQLCSVDTITVLYNFGGRLSQGATCGLGKFQKMEKAAQ